MYFPITTIHKLCRKPLNDLTNLNKIGPINFKRTFAQEKGTHSIQINFDLYSIKY